MNFSVLLDKRQPSSTGFKFTDTGSYGGIEVNFTGWYTVLQPDGATVTVGSYASPVIFYSSGALTTSLSELRLNTASPVGLNCNAGVPSHNFSTSAPVSRDGAHGDVNELWNEDVLKYMLID